jgi:hypothetical protein
MALKQSDFLLTAVQLDQINRYFEETAKSHALAGEDPPAEASVTFTWVPGLGRIVHVAFDGEVRGMDIL